jgi:serine/threonine-protein kinase
MIGRTLSQYRILAKLGEGGMGEVWKARDTTLDREVAIKVLPEVFARETERLARFEREAKVLASLNHPNIATIHGLHEAEGVHYLAMELVPGEDLAERLKRGPVPVEEALEIGRQVAAALAAAHANGVVHRDLKPANIQITPEGKVKVLDFGLAKALERETASGSSPELSPTLTSAGTVAGVILGTASYMSPEQARGRPIDKRADIWAFGCVLHEMLTGRKVFVGETISDTLAAVLRAKPDPDTLPDATPRSIHRLLRRCLEKDPDRRLHDIADAVLEIDDAAAEPEEVATTADAAPRRGRLPWILTALLAVVALIAIASSWLAPERAAPDSLSVSVVVSDELSLMGGAAGDMLAAISPDGRQLAFTARRDETTLLYLRSFDSDEVIEIDRTETASSPVFSPDGQWIAYFGVGGLAKVSVRGGAPVSLAEAPTSRGASWSPDGTIVYSPAYNSGLMRVSADGSEPQVLTTPDPERDERTHRWPDVLPNGKAVLYTIGLQESPGNYEDATIAVVDVATGHTKPLIEGASIARYAASGHLVYSRGEELFAAPFDMNDLEITGPPSLILSGVAGDLTSGAVHFGISNTGTLFYMPAAKRQFEGRLVWIDRNGVIETIPAPAERYVLPRLSPDGTRVVATVGHGLGDGDAYIYDLRRETMTRMTFDGATIYPIWSRDGERIVYGSTLGGDEGVLWKKADGSEAAERLVRTDGAFAAIPETWLPGRQTLVYSLGGGGGSRVYSLEIGAEEPQPVVTSDSGGGGARFSPDGTWMVYVSTETGRPEVFVRPYPGPGGKWQLSTEGGRGPIWSADGSEIFFTRGRKMFVVPVETEPTFSPGAARELFEFEFQHTLGRWADYDVTRDGQRFLMIQPTRWDPRQLNVITNFTVGP